MIKVVIVDDEQSSIDSLRVNIQENFNNEIEIIGTFTNPDEGVAGVKLLRPDVVIIDMHFPRTSGLIIAKQVAKLPVMPIFMTGRVEKIIEAFELSDLFYMLKPVRRIDLDNLIIRYNAYKRDQTDDKVEDPEITEKKIDNADNYITPSPEKAESSLFLNSLNKIDIVDLDKICYLEADGQHTRVVLAAGSTIVASKPLFYFQNLLEENRLFFRCHRSFIVNVKLIKNIEKNKYSYDLVMENQMKVSVSFLKKKELNEYLKSTII